ncbi:MAG: PEP-CTERM sorting domain-containing protein, partial [Opitutaceae bacterium]
FLSPAARIGTSGYDGITNAGGSLVLHASAIGTTDGIYNAAFNTTFNTGLLGVTLNNLFAVPPGNILTPLTYALSGVTANVPANWSVSFAGPITGNVVPVPEPSTYGLIAAGALLGLVAFRRMKARAQAV